MYVSSRLQGVFGLFECSCKLPVEMVHLFFSFLLFLFLFRLRPVRLSVHNNSILSIRRTSSIVPNIPPFPQDKPVLGLRLYTAIEFSTIMRRCEIMRPLLWLACTDKCVLYTRIWCFNIVVANTVWQKWVFLLGLRWPWISYTGSVLPDPLSPQPV